MRLLTDSNEILEVENFLDPKESLSIFTQILLSLLGFASILCFHVDLTPPATIRAEWMAAIRTSVEAVMPSASRACGYISFGEDPTDAIRCLQEAERQRAPYWVASKAQGEDSIMWIVVHGVPGSSMLRTEFTSGINGVLPRRPAFSYSHAETCTRLKFGKKIVDGSYEYYEPAITCE